MLLRMATAPARPDLPNEDFVAATTGAVVLLDGAGAPAGTPSGCAHGTPWFVSSLGTRLLNRIAAGQPLAEALADAIVEVAQAHLGTCDLGHPATPSATVVAVRRLDEQLDYLVLSDSMVVLDRHDAGPVAVTDDRQPAIAARLRTAMDALPTGSPEHTEALRAFLRELAAYRNRPGGFWVAGTDPQAAWQAIGGSMEVADLKAVALLSDGATRLVERFNLATWRQVMDILAEAGPEELARLTRTAEDGDPSGRRWPRGKVYDDCTAAYWALAPVRPGGAPIVAPATGSSRHRRRPPLP